MNEQIRKLAFQAMSINQKVSDDSFFVEVSKLNEFEKFAQLIVAECAEIALTDGQATGNFEVFNKITKHFGVE